MYKIEFVTFVCLQENVLIHFEFVKQNEERG